MYEIFIRYIIVSADYCISKEIKNLKKIILLSIIICSLFISFFYFRVKEVEVINPKMTKIIKSISVSGSIESFNIANISPDINGLKVVNVFIEKGNFVKKDSLLAILDRSDLLINLSKVDVLIEQEKLNIEKIKITINGINKSKEINQMSLQESEDLKNTLDQTKTNTQIYSSQLQQSKYQLKLDEYNYNKNNKLFLEGAITKDSLIQSKNTFDKSKQAYTSNLNQLKGEYLLYGNAKKSYQNRIKYKINVINNNNDIDINRANLKISESNIKKLEIDKQQATLNLKKAWIKSPIDGYVVERSVNIGNISSATQKFFSIVSSKNMYIKADVDELNLKKIKINQNAIIIADSFPEKPFNSKIYDIIPSINSDRGTVEIRLKLPKTNKIFLPNQTLSINIITDKFDQAIQVPINSVMTQSNKKYIYLEKNGLVIKKQLNVLELDKDFVIVKSDTNQIENIIKDPNLVKEGQRVKIIDSKISLNSENK